MGGEHPHRQGWRSFRRSTSSLLCKPLRWCARLFTGDVLDGRTAAEWGLANISVSADELETATMTLADRIAGVPRSHLVTHKLVVNQVMLNMGLEQTQMLATLFDSITRHIPKGCGFAGMRNKPASRPLWSGATVVAPHRRTRHAH
ncbi:MAG TPA: hypothetical protein VFY22_03280 [Hydrogenophaga sp.]|nr:hypothetical protein [Hydrogenophaga sp.]